MASFKVVKVEDKAPDWKVIDIEISPGVFEHNVSVNRTNKKGEIFPGFDDIKEGAMVSGNRWQSNAGKPYLFAPDPLAAPGGGGSMRGGGNRAAIKAAQEFKTASIDRAQDRREVGVKVAGAMRDATLIAIAALKDQPFPTDAEFKEELRKWRDWLISEFDNEILQRDI